MCAERVIGPAPKQRLHRQTQIQQDWFPLGTEPGRQPGQLLIGGNLLKKCLREGPRVCGNTERFSGSERSSHQDLTVRRWELLQEAPTGRRSFATPEVMQWLLTVSGVCSV